ncbi:MAG TPA: DUF1523 family protein [Rhodobacteraceae bacterium]|nr:DUF1523 family protein [Paracoccaceae bacterium]
MRKVKITLKILLFLFVGGFFHYVLPQHDIVRVTSTEVIRTDFEWYNRLFYAQPDSGNADLSTRDIRLINTEKKKTWLLGFIPRDSTEIMVYRNEDTGWIWPPYFKFDSSDLQAEAAALVSPNGDQWAVITHYGWRIKFLSVYPNAVAIRAVDNPNVTIIPWFNIFFFIFLFVAWRFVVALWRQFRERSVDPLLEDAGEVWDKVDDHADAASEKARGIWGRFKAWLATWRKK